MMPNADAIALGKQIKAVRKAMKMTQEQLALKSNVSVKYIHQYETWAKFNDEIGRLLGGYIASL